MGDIMAEEKLNALRAWMKSHHVDAYIIPHSDRFQSEYLRPEDERLAWVTGFTGSAGLAAITLDKAALFTDGRYTLQAAQQLDMAQYDLVESPPGSPLQWLGSVLSHGAKIGFDPWLLTSAQLNMWKKSAQEFDYEFVPLVENPVDTMWTDKRMDAAIQAEEHCIEFSGLSVAEKIDLVIGAMHAKAQTLLISEPALVCWLLNMRGRDVSHTPLVHSLALLGRDGVVTLLVDPQKIPDALRKSWGNHVAVEDLTQLLPLLSDAQAPIQIDPLQSPVAVKEYCAEHGIAVIEANDPSVLLRACKNETEIKGSQQAHDYDAQAFAEFRAWLKAQDVQKDRLTELDIIQKLRECRDAAGPCIDDSFDTIAGFGGNGAIVHYRADEKSNKHLTLNNLLLLDSGGQYRCGTTDVTRVFAIGTPTAAMKTHYTAVLKGLMHLSQARFPVGTTGAQLDAIARAPIWAFGLDYAHGTGHGVGSFLSVHEGPARISSVSHVPLQAGMILSIEPGIYLTDQYGIRLENLVVVTRDPRQGDAKEMLAFKTLTKIPFEAALIDWAQLSDTDIAWLKDFDTVKG